MQLLPDDIPIDHAAAQNGTFRMIMFRLSRYSMRLFPGRAVLFV